MNVLVQGSEEWLRARVGKATASEFHSVLAEGKGLTRAAYMRRLVSERLTGKPTEDRSTGSWRRELERGKEQEPFARMAYEARARVIIEEVGFIEHSQLAAGCSPDGLVGVEGGIEIKSVIPTVQVETVLAGGYPSEHRAQVQGNLWITGRRWWDFCSYCADMPGALRLYVFRVVRDETYIQALQAKVTEFLLGVDRLYEQLHSLAYDGGDQ